MPTDSDSRSDKKLIALANQGEEEAFAALYNRYRDWTWHLAMRFCGNEQDACDVVQQAFFYFFNKFPDFVLRAKLKTFLYPVIKHLALDHKKKTHREPGLPEDVEELPAPPQRDRAEERVEFSHRIARLPEEQQDVLFLRFVDDLSLKEIAMALEIPLGTAKSRLHNALAALR